MLGCGVQAAGGLPVQPCCCHDTSMLSRFCLSLLRLVDFVARSLAPLEYCSLRWVTCQAVNDCSVGECGERRGGGGGGGGCAGLWV